MFRKYCDDSEYKISEYSCSTHPHNYSVQILAEVGVLGYIIFISFYFILIKNFFNIILEKKNNKYKFPLYSLLILNLINFMPLFPSGNFLITGYLYLILLDWSLFIFEKKIREKYMIILIGAYLFFCFLFF